MRVVKVVRLALAVGASLVLLLALVLRLPPSLAGGACQAATGGRAGAQVQLQGLHVTERSVTFTFGNSSVPGGFDVPQYFVEQDQNGLIVMSVRGASSLERDGSLSYAGPVIVEPGLIDVRRVSLIDDHDRAMRWQIATASRYCPRVQELRYWRGSFSNVQLIITFGATSTLTVEPDLRPRGGPTWVNGAAFAPRSRVSLSVGNETVRVTESDGDGTFQTAIYVPNVQPGVYLVVARDQTGHSASAQLTVSDGTWP